MGTLSGISAILVLLSISVNAVSRSSSSTSRSSSTSYSSSSSYSRPTTTYSSHSSASYTSPQTSTSYKSSYTPTTTTTYSSTIPYKSSYSSSSYSPTTSYSSSSYSPTTSYSSSSYSPTTSYSSTYPSQSSYNTWSSTSHGGGGGSSTPGFVLPSGSTTYSQKSSTISSGGDGSSTPGFVLPGHPASSTYSQTSSSYGGSSGGSNGGFALPPTSSSTNGQKTVSSQSHGGGNSGFVVPSSGSSTYGSTGYGGSGSTTNAAGFVHPSSSSHSTITKDISQSSTSVAGIDAGFLTPSVGYPNYGTNYGKSTSNTAGFVIPSAPPLPPSGFVHPNPAGGSLGSNGKYTATTTTTSTTTSHTVPVPYNQNGHGGSGPSSFSYATYGSNYGNNPSYLSSQNNAVVDKSKTKIKIAPVFIPTSGYAYSPNGHRSYYHTQYVYRDISSGRSQDASIEDQEMIGRITAGGEEGTKPIILYEHTDHTGRGLVLSVGKGQCLDLPTDFNDLTSSINTYGHCFWLCEHSNCQGACKKFAPGVGNHKFVGDLYNDQITSVKQCNV